MTATQASATGHVKVVQRQRGEQVYIKFRCSSDRQVQKRLGPFHRGRGRCPDGYWTERMAEAELHAQLERCDRGECDHHGDGQSHTFGAACREWLRYGEQEAGWELTNRRNNRSSVNARLIPFFGDDTRVGEIATARIDAYRVHALVGGGKNGKPLARTTVQRDLTNLSGIFGRARRNGWIAANPYDEAERVKAVKSGDFNVLSVIEVEAVARAAGEQMAAMIRVAAYTGLRQGELRALRFRDVDFATHNIHVRRNLPAHGEEKVPKGKRVRSVPLLDQAAIELDALSRRGYLTRPDDRVFVSPTGWTLDDGDVRDGFYAALEAAGLGHLREREVPIRFHDLRHTFGTIAVQIWPLSDVQAFMGHADIKTTMIYVHHVPKTDAAAKGSAFIAAQMAPVVPADPCPETCPEPVVSGATDANSAQLSTA